MSNLQAYLASKYMSGAKADAILAREDAAKPKKKKRKLAEDGSASPSGSGSGSGIGIVDEDVGLTGRSSKKERGAYDDDDEQFNPLVQEEKRAFSSKTKKNWISTGQNSSIPLPPRNRSRSLSPSVIAENDPSLSNDLTPPPPPTKKRKGGLMTASEVAAEAELQNQLRIQEESRRAAENALNPQPGYQPPETNGGETIYRDRSGAIIDVKAERAEAKRLEMEEERKEREKKEWGKGLVQRTEKEERAKREREMGKSKAIGRGRDDKAMNEEMKEVERWDDPAAGFLTKKKSKGPSKPKYNGPPPPPNRFNIPPGYRWDGVDRSTGFENKLFQSINSKKRAGVEAAAWSMEDM